ncbi:MAG: peptide-methionine (S)-S-oxide reductase MsrA [Emcibacter sp.]|nr:peptide-methionine (S)-S-oxide reductase MsrA [Emcibacter sp.]
MEKATFAAGCFWGVQLGFDKLDGVISSVVGYMGGHIDNPSYEAVCTGRTNHAEVVEVTFDPDRISFDQLLNFFWQSHDPTTLNRQGPDCGSQYRSAVYYYSDQQKNTAKKSRTEWNASGSWSDPIVTEITDAAQFWPAEDYHQKYLEKRNITISCH